MQVQMCSAALTAILFTAAAAETTPAKKPGIIQGLFACVQQKRGVECRRDRDGRVEIFRNLTHDGRYGNLVLPGDASRLGPRACLIRGGEGGIEILSKQLNATGRERTFMACPAVRAWCCRLPGLAGSTLG